MEALINLLVAFVIVTLVIRVDDLEKRVDKLEGKTKQNKTG